MNDSINKSGTCHFLRSVRPGKVVLSYEKKQIIKHNKWRSSAIFYQTLKILQLNGKNS